MITVLAALSVAVASLTIYEYKEKNCLLRPVDLAGYVVFTDYVYFFIISPLFGLMCFPFSGFVKVLFRYIHYKTDFTSISVMKLGKIAGLTSLG